MTNQNPPRRSLRQLAVQAVVIIAASTGIVAVSATPSLAGCSHSSRNGPTFQFESVTGAGSGGVALRSGPHTSCNLYLRIPNGHQMEMYCYTRGDTINGWNSWSYVRYNSGSGDNFGWVADAYLTNSGAYDAC
ncbi:hypothetical protein ABZS77_26960 [Micromonospora sp. NPDC005298]|uniref:hypothetical protein n=1 Tax=Micromonospora sp. NPDC005298 TaxID=3156873 RepID=UPI0033B071C5